MSCERLAPPRVWFVSLVCFSLARFVVRWFVLQYDVMFINFYADWCRFSQMLKVRVASVALLLAPEDLASSALVLWCAETAPASLPACVAPSSPQCVSQLGGVLLRTFVSSVASQFLPPRRVKYRAWATSAWDPSTAKDQVWAASQLRQQASLHTWHSA